MTLTVFSLPGQLISLRDLIAITDPRDNGKNLS